MGKVKYIVIHATASKPSNNGRDIAEWYKNKYGKYPYHILINADGSLVYTTELPINGMVKNNNLVWGAKGYNNNAIHIAYVGGHDGTDTRTLQQVSTMHELVKLLKKMDSFKDAEVLGHYQLPSNPYKKTCPNFDAKAEFEKT